MPSEKSRRGKGGRYGIKVVWWPPHPSGCEVAPFYHGCRICHLLRWLRLLQTLRWLQTLQTLRWLRWLRWEGVFPQISPILSNYKGSKTNTKNTKVAKVPEGFAIFVTFI